jgi:hypothetical protein
MGPRTAGGTLATDASPCASLRSASPAGTLLKPHERQQLTHPSAPFSPARVDNLLESQAPRSTQGAAQGYAHRRCQPLATCNGQRPRLTPEQGPRVIWSCHRQQTGLDDAEAAGSFGGVGRGPTPPSSTAAP